MLPRLKVLAINSNPLRMIPNIIWNMTYLEDLNLRKTRLTHLPEKIGEFKNLRILDIAMNRLHALPRSLLQLDHLQELFCEGNPLNDAAIQLLEEIKQKNVCVSFYRRARSS